MKLWSMYVGPVSDRIEFERKEDRKEQAKEIKNNKKKKFRNHEGTGYDNMVLLSLRERDGAEGWQFRYCIPPFQGHCAFSVSRIC